MNLMMKMFIYDFKKEEKKLLDFLIQLNIFTEMLRESMKYVPLIRDGNNLQ